MNRNWKCLLGALVIAVASSTASASVRITPASGGDAISADTAANAISPAWTTLGPITIFEKSRGHRSRFKTGTNVTLVLKAPVGFEFNKNVVPSISFASKADIKSASVSLDATKVTVKMTVGGQAEVDSLVIGGTKGLQVRPTSGYPLATGNIYRPSGAAGGTAVIAGIKATSNPDGIGFNISNFGTFNQTAASAVAISINSQPSARAVVGLPLGRQPIIQVVDQYGNLVTNANSIVVHADIHSGAGVLLGNTSAPVVKGYATFTNLAASAASTIKLKFTAGALTQVISDPIVVDLVREPAVLTSLVVLTQPSPEADAGAIFAQQPRLKVDDQYDYIVTNDFNTIVTAARSAGSGDLQGTLTAQAVGGLVAFTNLSHNVAVPIKILFASPDIHPAVSDVVQIWPAVAITLAFDTQPGEANKGEPFGIQPVLVTRDQFGNNSNIGLSSNLLVTVALTSGTGPLTGTTTEDIGFDDGDGEVAFTDLAIGSAGINKQLTATAPGLNSAISAIFTVHGSAQTITFGPLSPKEFGDASFMVSATASSGLPVSFSIASGPATISGNVVTLIGAGTVTVRASQEGNADYDPAVHVDQSFPVSKAGQAITFMPMADKVVWDAPFPVSATASSGLPVSISIVSGPATLSGNMVTVTGVGVVTLRASQGGDSNYHAAADLDQSFTVAKANQTITFAPLANKVFGNAPFSVSATSSSGLSVSFVIVSGPATIFGNSITLTGTGTVVVRAYQGGDPNYNAASNVDRSFEVAKASQSILVGALPIKTYGDAPFLIGASASSGLTVSFEVLSGPAALTNNVLTITGAGEIAIRCVQSGDSNYNPATLDQGFVVAKAPLVVQANNVSRMEGNANSELTGSISGLVNGDTITASYQTTATTSSPVGTYPITVSVHDPEGYLENYNSTIMDGTLTVLLAMPAIINQTSSLRTNQGANVTLVVDATGTGINYQWRFNGGNIPGATGSSLTLSRTTILQSGVYDVLVSNGAGTQTSAASAVEIFMILGDLDQNGQADILLQRTDGRLACWYMDGTTFQSAALLRNGRPLNPGWNVAGEHDFNGDGHADILLRNSKDGRIALWLMNGGQFESAILLNEGRPINPAWKVVGVHDFNGDGNVDILLQHTDGRLSVRYMNGTTFIGGTLLRDGRPVAPAWKVVGVRDFNADGQGDILFRNADGRLAVWFMDGINFVGATALRRGPAPETGWKLVGLSDFNKDGKTDLLWQNRFDGRIAVWTLDGTTFVNNSLMRVGNPIWRIVGAR
ncbi:MAG: VCBS repeat-containing protein [Verrucomicrobia bacterium]|nr:VCBS repeat-containing protein [Verrucomicrobiota bacterium]